MSLKVLTVTNMWPTPDRPHYGIFVREHVEALRRLGLDMDVFFTDAKIGRRRYLLDLPRLASAVRRGRYDVIHAHHTYSLLQLALVRLHARHVPPIVSTLHEGEAHLPRRGRDPGDDLVRRLVYWNLPKRFALKTSDCVVSVNAALPGAVGHRGQHVVMAPGVDMSLFRPMDRADCRRTLGLPQHGPILLFPASRSRRHSKGVDLLEASLEYLAAPVHVLFGGSISREDMPTYMNASDVVVQTSRFEASPMAIKEAMACNRPVVSTKVGDVPSLFEDTPGCFLTEPDPPAIAATIGEALRFPGRMQGRVRIMNRKLALEEVAARHADLYQRVASV